MVSPERLLLSLLQLFETLILFSKQKYKGDFSVLELRPACTQTYLAKTLGQSISEARSLNSITRALYRIRRRQHYTGCSFQLLSRQIPKEISFSRTMHFFPLEKKERKSISAFNTWGSRSIWPGPFFPFFLSISGKR